MVTLVLINSQHWVNGSFERISLKELGASFQLMHHASSCEHSINCHKKLRVLHWNGIHDVDLKFCGCKRRREHYVQLLRHGLYPVTQTNGRITTVATFGYLELLHNLVLTTKCSTYDVYRAAVRATDATGNISVPWRYKQLVRMQLQWRHLKLLKRNGRGHDPSGVEGTNEGELAILCPSCPHPGINLPNGWQQQVASHWLYALRLAMDANFRLKEQLVSSHSRDPGLCDGLGYFVRREPYERYVLSRADKGDVCLFWLLHGSSTDLLSRLPIALVSLL